MNKKITAALLLTLPCLAYAQTSSPDKLVLYGALDAGFQYQHLHYKSEGNINGTIVHGDKVLKRAFLTDGYLVANRVGLFGAHKLADRFYTIFNLEAGFNLKDGSQKKMGVLFSRKAFLGLQGVFGRFTVGNQSDAVNELLGPDPFGAPGSALYYDLFGSTVGTVSPNTIQYLTPEYKGVQLGASFNTKDKTATQPKEHSYAVAGHFKQEKYSISTGYIHNNRKHTSSWVINGTVKAGPVTLYGRYARANSYQSTFLNQVFCLGHTGFNECNDSEFDFVKPKINVWSLGAKVPVSKSGDLILSFQQGHESSETNHTKGNANFYRIAYQERFSKHTFLYTFGGLFKGQFSSPKTFTIPKGTMVPAPKDILGPGGKILVKKGQPFKLPKDQEVPGTQHTKLTGYGIGFGFVHTF